MICNVSKVIDCEFMVHDGKKAKAYRFDNKSSATRERAKLVKYMKEVPGMKIHFG